MIECPEYTLSLPPPCPTNRDHLTTSVQDVLDGRLDGFVECTRINIYGRQRRN